MRVNELLYHTGQGELRVSDEWIPVEYTLMILQEIHVGQKEELPGIYIAGGEFSMEGSDIMIPHGSELSMRFENGLEVKIKVLYLDSLSRREFDLLGQYVESCLEAFKGKAV